MPGNVLTLDLVANDQASRGIGKVAEQTGLLSTELAALIKATRRLDAVFKSQKGTATSVVREEAKLTSARAQLLRATVQNERAERAVSKARERTARETRTAALGGEAGVKALNQLTRGLAGGVAQYGALGPAAAAAAASVAVFSAAVDVSVSALRAQFAALTASVKSAAAFEQEITRVSAVTGGAAGSFEKLRAAALAGGASTLFTAQQAAEGLRFLAQAGLSADQAASALPGSLQLAAAGSLDLAKAADIATNILSGFKLDVEELSRVNDVLVLGASRSNTTVTELGTAFSYAAGIAKSTGNEFEDVAALFSVLANNGIKASRAGTAVAGAIARIQKPTPEAQKALARLGVTLTDAEGQTKPLVQVLRELEKAGADTKDVITIFGQVAGRSLTTVLNSGTKEIDRFAEANRRAQGTAEQFQRTLQDTAEAQGKIFLSTVETLSIAIGSEFLPNVKGVSQAFTEQTTIALQNNDVLKEFGDISDSAARATSALLRVAADVVPPLIKLGGAVLVLTEHLDRLLSLLAQAAKAGVSVIPGLGGAAMAVITTISALTELGSTMGATGAIAEETRARLLAAADGVGSVNSASVRGKKILADAASSARQFALEVGLIDPPPKLITLGQLVRSVRTGYEEATKSAQAFFAASGGGEATSAPAAVPPELLAKRELAKLEAQIANTSNARQRAALEFELELAQLKGQDLDEEVRLQKELAALGRLQAKERADAASRQRKSSKEDLSGKLRELELQRRLVTAQDERLKIQLTFEQAVARIAASQDKQALKDAQIAVARAQAVERLAQLEQERAAALRDVRLQVAEQEVQLGRINQMELISLQTAKALADLADERDLSPQVRAERERLILLQEQVKVAGALRETRAREIAREESFTQLALERLGQRQGVEAQVQRVLLESADRRRRIEAEELDLIVKKNKLLAEREQTEQAIAQVRTQEALRRTEAVRQGVSAGAATDTSSLQAAFASEAEADLNNKVRALELVRQAAAQRGQDTEFLERRISALKAEAEAERAVAESMVARIEATGQLAAGVADLSTRLADVARLGFEAGEGYEAMGAAIGAAAGLGGALAQGLGVSAKTAAKIQASFNAAAAIGAFAAYAASGFAAPNFLTASIQYGIAAAKFGVVAGVSAGAGSGRSGGATGGAGAGASAPSYNAAAERDKTAQAFAKALREQLERPVQNIYNLDFRQATLLETNPAVGRQIADATERAQGAIYQSGRRVG